MASKTKKIAAAPYVAPFANLEGYAKKLAEAGYCESLGVLAQLDGMRAVMAAAVMGLVDHKTAAAEAFRAFREGHNANLPSAACKPTEGKAVESDVSRWNTGVRLAGMTVGKTNAATLFLAKYGDRPEYYGNPTNRFPSAVRQAIKAAELGLELTEANFLKAVSDGKNSAPETDVEFCNRLAKSIADRLKGNAKKGKPAMRDSASGDAKAAMDKLLALVTVLKARELQPTAGDSQKAASATENAPNKPDTKLRHAKRLSDLDSLLAAKTEGAASNGHLAH